MTRILIILVAALAVTVGYTTPSDACGVKLTVKSPKVKKRVKRTSYPSHVLVLGTPPSRRLSRWLNQAGHTVETTKSASSAKRKDYAVVIADPEKVDEARSNFPRSRVVTRSGTLSSNVRKIERVLARAPGQGDSATVVASRPAVQRSRRAGVSAPDQVRAPREEPKVEAKPEPRVAAVETAEPKEPAMSRQPEPSDEPEDDGSDSADDSDDKAPVARKEPKAVSKGKWTKELYFGSNSTDLDSRSRSRLKANAQWLAANPDVSITIEGHTDSAGPAEYNKVLGERRAESVRDFLVEQGVDSSRIEVISYGEERPAYSSGRKNRRVLIVKN